MEIKAALQDLPYVIEKVRQKRKNIEDNNVPIRFLIYEEKTRDKLCKMNIQTLKDMCTVTLILLMALCHIQQSKK